MADFKFQRETHRFYCLGLDLNRPVDAVKELKYPRLTNVRTYKTGRLEARPGLSLLGTVEPPAHSIRRLNAPRTGDWTRMIGGGTTLNYGKGPFTQIDTGYSGDPLALVTYRPAQSPDPWMYVMDSARQRKADVTGTLHQVGLPPPTTAPTVTRLEPQFKSLFTQPMSTTGWWYGPAFVCTFLATDARVNTTITSISYDSGSTGWCAIYPASLVNISEGMDLVLNSAETILVHDVHQGSLDSRTITAIDFLSGTDGECSIVLSSMSGVEAGVLLENTTASSFATVKAVVAGPDESSCVLLSTPTASTWAATDTVYARPSFRCWTDATFSNSNTVTNTSLKFHINATADPDAWLFGWVISPKFTPPLDLSQIAPGVDTHNDDYLYLSFAFQASEGTDWGVKDVAGGKIFLGCYDAGLQLEATSRDHYYCTFTPQDFIPIERPSATDPLAPAAESPTKLAPSEGLVSTSYLGRVSQTWGLLRLRIADLVPVGNPSLKAIYYVKIEMSVVPPTEQHPYPGCEIYFGSFELVGGYAPDVGIGSDYIYRYRARCSSTGVVSNWGPPTREAFYLRREKLEMEAPAQYALAAEADYLDFQRRGGVLTDWYYVGSVPNGASPTTFTDNFPDDVVVANPSEGQIHFQLWPVLGAPVEGTTSTVCGTTVRRTVDTPFSTSWAPGTIIEINRVAYTIYVVRDANTLELYENAGSQGAVTWMIAEPVIAAQPMACFWGPLGETFFACGDPVNPQRLYWTNIGSADDTQLIKWRDITTPSEPLMNGVVYNGRLYLWSSERMFQILPEGDGWNCVEVPNGKGLYGRWCYTGLQTPPGFTLHWLGRDGIYQTDGGAPSSMTDEDLRPYFPNEGNMGEVVNGYQPPYLTPALAPYHRLAYYDDYLYYDFVDRSSIADLTVGLGDSILWQDRVASSDLRLALTDSIAWSDVVSVYAHPFASALSDSIEWSDSVEFTLVPDIRARVSDSIAWSDAASADLL